VNKPTGPTITVRSPEAGGEEKVYPLAAERVTVGRSVPGHEPDIALGPDPQSWISRLHCWFERAFGSWYIVDNGSVNGTMFERQGRRDTVEGRLRLQDKDEVLILGYLVDDEPFWWRLRIDDPFATADGPPSPGASSAPHVEYRLTEAKLVVVQGNRRTEIRPLGRNRHKLVRYMASRNAANGGTPVTCTHEELIAAVWGEPETWRYQAAYTRENLRDLVHELRKQLGHDDLVETIPGIGYRLHTQT
jgi:FHA domain/Transcriptional regulatory protein, C terminal